MNSQPDLPARSDSNTQAGASTRSLQGQLPLVVAALAAFSTYFCMYAFRKPFSAGVFTDSGFEFWGIGLKTALVLAQLIGYMLSKFIGIRLISEMRSEQRAWTLFGLILFAEATLVGFAFLPIPLKILMMFLNGLPLGMVFGLVLGFLEGRRQTEALSAVLCASFIWSSGVVKSVGVWMIGLGVSEFMMPMLVGLVFLPPLGIAVWILQATPPPDAADRQARQVRTAMTRTQRGEFIASYWSGIMMLVVVYTALTIIRTIRDDFGVELWRDMGISNTPAIFATSETIVALVVTMVSASAMWIGNNRTALRTTLAMMGGMCAIVGISGVLYSTRTISPLAFMVICGVGLYFPYVAFHTTVFERLIAVSQRACNLGFLMYFADSIGYLGYAMVILCRSLLQPPATILPFYLTVLTSVSLTSVVLLIAAVIYFEMRLRAEPQPALEGDSP